MIEDKEKEDLDAVPHTDNGEHDVNVNWTNVFFILVAWKKKIMITTAVVMVLTAGTLVLMIKWYESTAVILLPEKTGSAMDLLMSSAGGSGGGGSALAGLGANILGAGSSNMTRYLAIFNSRRLREDLINRYNLIEAYDVKKTEDALKILEKDLFAEADKKFGTIVITFRYFGDNEKTAEMANYVVSKLDEINRELSTEQGRTTRQFIQDRYNGAKKDLRASEDSLNRFQNTYGVISLPDQTKAAIEAAAKLQVRIVATETEYNVMKKTLGGDHPDLMRLESELQEMKKTQGQMEYGGLDLSVFLPFKKTPDLALQYIRFYRDVQINSKIVEFLVPQLEQAKIQEAKDTPTLLVLDKARPAGYSYKPKKKIIVSLSGLLAFMIWVLLAYSYDKIRRILGTHSQKRAVWLSILNFLKLRKLFN